MPLSRPYDADHHEGDQEGNRARETAPPDLLLLGHATRDLLPNGDWRLGGSVTYGALTAARLGIAAAVVTSASSPLLEELRQALSEQIPLAAIPANDDTTFENIYTHGSGTRRQYLRARAQPLSLASVPQPWRSAPMVLLAPLAQEIPPSLASAFPQALVAATPQGWLRQWSGEGLVSPGPFRAAREILPHLNTLVLSREDLLAPPGSRVPAVTEDEAGAQIAEWAQVAPLVVETQGERGALLYVNGGAPESFAGYPAHPIDPTGAGDVFAAAFLIRLHETGDPRAAVDFANRVAALSVEGLGITGIPTRRALHERYPELA